jgi:hypothetical protein
MLCFRRSKAATTSASATAPVAKTIARTTSVGPDQLKKDPLDVKEIIQLTKISDILDEHNKNINEYGFLFKLNILLSTTR